MEEKKDYVRINTSLELNPGLDMLWNENGKSFNSEFLNRLIDYNKYFRSILEKRITDVIGADGWAIQFIQISPYNASMFGDIYVDNPDYFNTIKNICIAHIDKEFTISYYHKGNLQNYLRQ